MVSRLKRHSSSFGRFVGYNQKTSALTFGVRTNVHIYPFKDEAQTDLFKDPVRTAQETLFISVIKKVAQIAVCSQINIKHINTVWAECTVVEC